MSPKTVGALSKFSHLMSLQSTPDIEQLIRSDFVALIAEAIDTAAINGSGSSNQPLGILNTSGIGSVAGGTNGLPPTLDNLWTSRKRSPSITLMSPPAGSSRTRKSSRFLESSRTVKASTSSALMELNLAVPRLQGGVLRSATMSPQTSQRVQGPTCPLSSTEISPTCLSGSLVEVRGELGLWARKTCINADPASKEL